MLEGLTVVVVVVVVEVKVKVESRAVLLAAFQAGAAVDAPFGRTDGVVSNRLLIIPLDSQQSSISIGDTSSNASLNHALHLCKSLTYGLHGRPHYASYILPSSY